MMGENLSGTEIKTLEHTYVAQTYGRFELCLVSGKGCRATDADGKSYLDLTSGIGVNSLGYADAAWAAAVAGQAATLQHTSNLYYTAPMAKLAEKLCEVTGMARVFFANSGAEANEGAIKAARKYSSDKYGPGRHVIVCLDNSFHGRTMATLTATGQEAFHKHFHPFPGGFAHLSADDLPALEKALDGKVCAVMLEPIQGEGGVVPLGRDYLAGVQALCKQRDVLLICDEVQTGAGRSGAFLAGQKYGLRPDIVTLAKGLGGGLPIGAVLFAPGCAGVLGKGDHGSTYGANPVCCAGALAVMERLDEGFLREVERKGAAFREALAALPGVAGVSGDGLMLGIQFAEGIAAPNVLQAAMKKGLLCLLAKDRMRLLPPLVISDEELAEAVGILKETLEELA